MTYKIDNFTIDILFQVLDNYNANLKFVTEINKSLNYNVKHKKIRRENFRTEISENIAKFVFYKKYNVLPNWNTKSGDLGVCIDGEYLKLEIKGFMSDGPTTFGPTEEWDRLYFVDCRNTLEKNFIVYEMELSSKSDIWNDIKLTNSDNG